MKGVVDLFVSKDKIAVFWFLVAVIAVIGSGWYVQSMVKQVTANPNFVIMDGAGVYYIAPSLDFSDATEIHASQTRMATETFFNRGPSQSDSQDRIKYLFSEAAQEFISTEYSRESNTFETQQIHQKVEIGDIQVLQTEGTRALTSATGQVIRVGVFNGEQVVDVYDLSVKYMWMLNRDMRNNGRFPTVCAQMKYELIKR